MAEWASQFEGENYATELVGLAVDSEGDAVLAGHVFEEDTGFANGHKDAVIMKLASANGDLLWKSNIGQKGTHDWSTAVASDTKGNFFVSGQTDGGLYGPFSGGSGQDIWVVKVDGSRGSVMWGYQVGSSGHDVASTLTVDPVTGHVVVCGSTTGGLFEDPKLSPESGYVSEVEELGDSGSTEPFCAKLATSDGYLMWASRLKGGGNDGILAAAINPINGDIFAAGYATQKSGIQGIDVVAVKISGRDGSELWRKMDGGGWMRSARSDGYVQDSAHAIAADGNGDVVIAGNTEGALFGSMAAGRDTDAFVAKLNGSDGGVAWGWQRGSGGNDYVNDVAVDAAGDVYACGAAMAGLFDDDEGRRLKQGGEGQNSAGSGVADVFLVKLDGRSGRFLWGAQFGSGEDDQAVGIVLGPVSSSAPLSSSSATGVSGAGDGGGSEGSRAGNPPLYLTGWTRGALYSNLPARWQDGWAVKLPNPPRENLGFTTEASSNGRGGGGDAVPTPGTTTGSSASAASHAARGAVTLGFVSTLSGMAMLIIAALCVVLRRASNNGGALVPPRQEQAKTSMFRRRNRAKSPDGGVAKTGTGSAGGKESVEMKLLSDGGDGVVSTPSSSRHGGGSGPMGRRDATPPSNTPQATFYI